MMTACIALLPLLLGAQQETLTYSDPQLGLSFSHPKSWVVQKPAGGGKGKKGSKDGDIVTMRIPVEGSAEGAELTIVRAQFNGSPEVWQQIQVTANRNLKREVERQWQQEILNVPLLLTRISFSENGTAKSAVTGLLYNDAPYKLLFRLSGPASDFDKAQFEFTQAMESLRTTDNSLPKAQEPDKPSTAPKVAPTSSPAEQRRAISAPKSSVKLVKASVVVPVVISTKNVELRLPEGWTATDARDGQLTLNHPGVPGGLLVRLYSSLDSESMATALRRVSAVSLADYDKVSRREDPPIRPNRAGCTIASVWRTGTGPKGALATFEAGGMMGDFYFIATYRLAAGSEAAAQRVELEALLSQVSLEPAP